MCALPRFENGTLIDQGVEARPKDTASAIAMGAVYVAAIEAAIEVAGVSYFDAALVDGRFRAACALRLLHHVNMESVVFMHDFWPRIKSRGRYDMVLSYYDVIGYARSLVVLRRKPPETMPADWQTVWRDALPSQEMAEDGIGGNIGAHGLAL